MSESSKRTHRNQSLYMKAKFMGGVANGSKTGTIRKGKTKLRKGPVTIRGGSKKIKATVVGILTMQLKNLKQKHIDATGESSNPRRYAVALKKFYPSIKLSDTISIIYFKVAR